MMEFNNYAPEDLDKQYNLRLYRPDYDSKVVPAWTERSAAYRASAQSRLDLPYGLRPRERLDFFPAIDGANGPVVVYFHGGYWQRGDKSVYSFLAEPFVKNGISIAFVNYDLCPSVTISEIAPQTRRAVAWVWRNAAEFGVSQDKVYVMGHSAGGHITAMLMATDWPALAADLPRDLVKGGIPLSGLFELAPMIPTSINTGVRMDEAEAAAASPMNNPPATNAPQLVVCGGRETPEFHRQSDVYADVFATPARRMERYTVRNCDHFDLLNDLADEKSEFFQKTLGLITGANQYGPTMSLIDEMMDAYNRHDLQKLNNYFAEDAVMVLTAGPDYWGAKLEGKAAIMEGLAKRFAGSPDLQWNDAKVSIMGNKVLKEWHVTGTQPNGEKLDCLGCDLLEFRGNQIVKKDSYYKNVKR